MVLYINICLCIFSRKGLWVYLWLRENERPDIDIAFIYMIIMHIHLLVAGFMLTNINMQGWNVQWFYRICMPMKCKCGVEY